MALIDQIIMDRYALYCGDSIQVMPNLPNDSVGFSIYSPPFGGLYNYSSSDYDMSNNSTYEGFLDHYQYLIKEISRVTMPGRITAVHCMDIPNKGQKTGYYDLPGKIITAHEKEDFYFFGRIAIWKEPLRVAIRTRLIHLTHKQVVKDSTRSTIAAGDFLLLFKKKGENKIPVDHVGGFQEYIGGREVPKELFETRGCSDQKLNKFSHWIWRNYASCFWDDIRIERVLPYKPAKDEDDEKHIHPLQLDVIERAVVMWSNPDDVVFSPFMGVGSEIYGALCQNRKGLGIELKPSYFRQAKKNIETISQKQEKQLTLC